MKSYFSKAVSTIVVLTMLLSAVPADVDISAAPHEPAGPTLFATGLYRTRVTLRQPADRSRLDEMGVTVLDEGRGWAVVLVDQDQLETLARLRFQPRGTDELGELAQSLDLSGFQKPDRSTAALSAALSFEQQAALTSLSTVDNDGDGLTNTEEQWWCTDPNNDNSDGDAQGYKDGQEVFALLDLTLPRATRWNYGPPFGPPNAWPDWNGKDGDPTTPTCNDGDFDTIPDLAEAFMVGTRVGTGDSENTDGDKFDDGQELFGTTYCPGGDAYCGYGSYPRTQDYSFISNGMPSWIRPPGDSPFVAAYPVIEMQIDPNSVRVTTKEIRTVERTITKGEEISEGFAETEGKSTTVGTIDTNTHSTWQENSTTEGGIEPINMTHHLEINQSIEPRSYQTYGASKIQAALEPTQTQKTTSITQRTLQDRIEVEQVALSQVKRSTLALADYAPFQIETVKIQDDWAFLNLASSPLYSSSNTDLVVPDILLAVGHKNAAGDWEVYVQDSDNYLHSLQELPETLLSDKSKTILLAASRASETPHQTYSIPALPWPIGNAWRYNQSAIGRTHPSFNQALDFGTPDRTSAMVYAADNGVVVEAKETCLGVLREDGLRLWYQHIQKSDIERWSLGQEINIFAPIGATTMERGCGGYSEGHHLHFEFDLGYSNNFPLEGSSINGWVIEGETLHRYWRPYGCTVITHDEIVHPNSSDTVLHFGNLSAGDDPCFVPAYTSDKGGQPNSSVTENGTPTNFWEKLGQTIRSWFGGNSGGGGVRLMAATTTAMNYQAIGTDNDSHNFSDFRSQGQCGTGLGSGGSGTAISRNNNGGFTRLRVWSETTTNGEGNSFSHSELRSETNYREVTRSRVNTLVSSEAWATATAVDPTDAGVLAFNYYLKNVGSDAAVNITDMDINILIGNLPVITWRAPDRSNILPGQTKGPFGSDPLKLSLEQLAAIDNGEPIRVVLADYGYDDQLYDQNAWGRSVLFHVDDDIADGDLSEDTYLIATQLTQGETYQDTLARYFDVDVFDTGADDQRNGTITNIRTPEFDPSGEIIQWLDHPVNEHAWWEISISIGGETEGIEHFKDMPAKPRTDIFLKYLVDSDGDGYTDRAEQGIFSDPYNSNLHPRPALIAAQHIITDGNTATVQLSLQNNGNFDASSVEVWAIAPDDTITMTDNLIGGGGRVRAGSRVVVGARIGAPDLSGWITSTAKPYVSGQFEGSYPKTYFFRADTSGTAGSTAGLTVSWSDDRAAWMALDVGAGYTPGQSLVVTDGVKIAFTGGTINGGDTFEVETAMPIDTFSFQINRTPYTPPLIVVSYNDPQGNHKFTSDVELDQIQDELTYYQGLMRHDVQLDVVSDETFAPGANTAHLIFNNPSDTTITEGSLFVEFAAPDGTVAKEYVLQGQTFFPGPNVMNLAWNTAGFSPTFDLDAEYTILAFATDRQGTIIENTVKDMERLGHDALSKAVLPTANWNFGTATKGEALHRTLDLANTGFADLLTHVSAPIGMSIAQGHRRVRPTDVESLDLVLDTSTLPNGPYDRTVTVRSSDPNNPVVAFQVTGIITDAATITHIGDERPLDLAVVVPGSYVSVYPATCQEIRASDPAASDGDYTLFLDNDPAKSYSIYCYNMAITPTEYLPLVYTGGSYNFSRHAAGGHMPGTDVVSRYSKVRIDPYTLVVDRGDKTFATSTGHSVGAGHDYTSMSYATAHSCIGEYDDSGTANVDLRGTEFAIDDSVVFQVGGWTAKGNTSFSSKRQIVNLTGGGACGYNRPTQSTPLKLKLIAASSPVTPSAWVTFTHGLGPDAQSLHPLKVYNSGYDTLWGVGIHAIPFSNGSSGSMLGDGSNGMHVISINTTDTPLDSSCVGISGTHILTATNPAFRAGQRILIHQTRGANAGMYQITRIESYTPGTIVTGDPLVTNYSSAGDNKAQVLVLKQYTDVTVEPGVSWTAKAWNGETGGILAFYANGTVNIAGTVTASGRGFRGGTHVDKPDRYGHQGESYSDYGTFTYVANEGGGGAGYSSGPNSRGGGGGGYATSGATGGGGDADSRYAGRGGASYGQPELASVYFGSGGGAGGDLGNQAVGGSGGGAIFIFSRDLIVSGDINAAGQNGSNGSFTHETTGGGGGGAGGSVLLKAVVADLGVNKINVQGGAGGVGTILGGVGGQGRIRLEYCSSSSGTTTPPASTQKLDCHIVEQIESTPYNTARLELPEEFIGGRTYQVQYGRRLVFTDTGEMVTTLRVPAHASGSAILDVLVSDVATSTLTVKLDIGNNGSWDWQTTQLVIGSTTSSSPDLAAAFNQYWTAQGSPSSGTLDVPVRVSLSYAGQVLLTNLYMPPIPPDASVTAGDIAFGAANPIESQIVPVTVTLHNQGGANTGGLTAAFYADPLAGANAIRNTQYVGSAFISNIPPNSIAQAHLAWNTLGFTGTVPVRVVIDPYGRLLEDNEDNNEASATITILTRPDLTVPQIALSDDEPLVGEAVTVTLALRNSGQAPVGSQTAALYQGSPDAGGMLLGATSRSVAGETEIPLTFTWTPTAPGAYRLFAVSDRDDTVNEYDESNNRAWRDVYVGFAGPLLLDSGHVSGDPAYTASAGYGYVDEGWGDAVTACDGGVLPEETLRRDPGGRVVYRFDHLLPGHFYHLDVTLYECDRAGRQESVYVDGSLVAGPVDLQDGEVHHLSLLLDPALYADNHILVSIQAPGVNGALVSQINLHDVDYRYADAGGSPDPAYTPSAPGGARGGYGWLDGVANANWGALPYQSVRVDQDDNELRYRFDGLDPLKQYDLLVTFWQAATVEILHRSSAMSSSAIQKVQIDGVDTGLTVDTTDLQVHRESVPVPLSTYIDDGSILVSIVRLDAASGAMVSQIALEERTRAPEGQCVVQETPYWSDVYGGVVINGQLAPVGAVVQALNPRGDVVGCFVVANPGQYGFMRIYGEDDNAAPIIPGMRDGELVTFRVNGALAVATPLYTWHDDRDAHRVDLGAGGIEGQSVLLKPGWNLFSLRVESPVPLASHVLASIVGRYDLVLGDGVSYSPWMSDTYNTLRELHAGRGYFIRLTGSTSVNAFVQGIRVPVTTPIPLLPGWNWIGYLPQSALPITTALGSIEGHYQRVLSLDKAFDVALPEFSTLWTMEPGQGYLIYVTDAVTLTYPTGTGRALAQSESLAVNLPSPCRGGAGGGVSPTPYLTLVYGRVTINGRPAPAGTQVEVLTPRGQLAGCAVVDQPGQLRLTHVYGGNPHPSPLPGGEEESLGLESGFVPGELLAFRVNGLPAQPSTGIRWQDDRAPHAVVLDVSARQVYLPLVIRNR